MWWCSAWGSFTTWPSATCRPSRSSASSLEGRRLTKGFMGSRVWPPPPPRFGTAGQAQAQNPGASRPLAPLLQVSMFLPSLLEDLLRLLHTRTHNTHTRACGCCVAMELELGSCGAGGLIDRLPRSRSIATFSTHCTTATARSKSTTTAGSTTARHWHCTSLARH